MARNVRLEMCLCTYVQTNHLQLQISWIIACTVWTYFRATHRNRWWISEVSK